MILNLENVLRMKERKFFTSLIFLTSNNFELKMERVSKFSRRASFLQKSTKNVHIYEKLLILNFNTNNEFSILFKPFENSSALKKIEDSK